MLNSAISAAPAANAENALATVIPNPMAAGQRRRHHSAIKAANPSVESTKSSRSECSVLGLAVHEHADADGDQEHDHVDDPVARGALGAWLLQERPGEHLPAHTAQRTRVRTRDTPY